MFESNLIDSKLTWLKELIGYYKFCAETTSVHNEIHADAEWSLHETSFNNEWKQIEDEK